MARNLNARLPDLAWKIDRSESPYEPLRAQALLSRPTGEVMLACTCERAGDFVHVRADLEHQGSRGEANERWARLSESETRILTAAALGDLDAFVADQAPAALGALHA